MKPSIGIIGLGRLGLCLALNLEKVGYTITGVEVNTQRLEAIRQRTLQTAEPGVTELLAQAAHLQVSNDLKTVLECDLVFVVVHTATLAEGGYDHSALESVFDQLLQLKANRSLTLVVNCTTMPGFCDEHYDRLKAGGFELVYNPEFIAQGSILNDQRTPDQVLIGARDDEAAKAVEHIYANLCTNQPTMLHMGLKSAEMAKLATNCFLTMKIAFANAVGDLALASGAEADKILNAVGADHRIGPRYLKYGFGYGGPCFPRDNRALIRFAQQEGMDLILSEATDQANAQHLEVQLAHYRQQPDPIIFDHVTYKPGTDILEESQQLALALRLAKEGRKVVVKGAASVIDQLKSEHGNLFVYQPIS